MELNQIFRTASTLVVTIAGLTFGGHAVSQTAPAPTPPQSATQTTNAKKPNILVIMGDDIGLWNLSIWNRGTMGFSTPNIDRIGQEGAILSTYYGQQSCTAGRAAFITGQSPFRTGLTKVGLPGASVGLQKEDPTLAELLKPLGYATGQFGKNHLGDRDEYLPTAHGFDEFFGNLYHLNAEEEPENPDYPKDAEFRKKFGPRGVIKASADGKIEDTGALTRKRMETSSWPNTISISDRATQEAPPTAGLLRFSSPHAGHDARTCWRTSPHRPAPAGCRAPRRDSATIR
ncbi:MAG: hypothetical protein E2579_24600 [Pseudomonas sp.]|nr:hypothetical protein [Pseudomonas sp.]